MNDLDRLSAAMKVEELAMRLEATQTDHNRILGDLLKSMQEYIDLCDIRAKERGPYV